MRSACRSGLPSSSHRSGAIRAGRSSLCPSSSRRTSSWASRASCSRCRSPSSRSGSPSATSPRPASGRGRRSRSPRRRRSPSSSTRRATSCSGWVRSCSSRSMPAACAGRPPAGSPSCRRSSSSRSGSSRASSPRSEEGWRSTRFATGPTAESAGWEPCTSRSGSRSGARRSGCSGHSRMVPIGSSASRSRPPSWWRSSSPTGRPLSLTLSPLRGARGSAQRVGERGRYGGSCSPTAATCSCSSSSRATCSHPWRSRGSGT